jgi:prepilin-type N-terminal cleavage/methylation domain-containing protein
LFCIRKLLKAESGYSLIEVLAAMVILTLAIIPMVGLFDAGLRGTVSSSNYDKARALANLKMEQAKNQPFATVESSFPVSPSTPDVDAGGFYQSGWTPVADTDPTLAGEFPDTFEYMVEKQYMVSPPTLPDFEESSAATKLIKLTITVRWDSDTTYTTHGLVTE